MEKHFFLLAFKQAHLFPEYWDKGENGLSHNGSFSDSKGRPEQMILWLHPSHHLLQDAITKMVLDQRRGILLVPVRKQCPWFWTPEKWRCIAGTSSHQCPYIGILMGYLCSNLPAPRPGLCCLIRRACICVSPLRVRNGGVQMSLPRERRMAATRCVLGVASGILVTAGREGEYGHEEGGHRREDGA